MTETERTLLVTGGTGFLGDALVRRLCALGHEVRVFSRTPPKTVPEGRLAWIRGTVLDRTALARAAAGVDTLFHLAGAVQHTRREGYVPMRELHVTGTANAVEIAREVGVRRVVAASTSGTVGVGPSADFLADDDAPYATRVVRRWPYYLTKVEAEHALFDRAAALDVDVVAVRPSLLLGPGDDRRSSTAVVADFVAGRIPLVPSGGLNAVDVRDVADALVAVMDHPSPARSYLLGGHNLTFRDLFARLEALSGVRGPRWSVPYAFALAGAALARPFSRDASLDPVVIEMTRHYWYVDSPRARRDLAFVPRPLDETLTDTLSYLRTSPS